VAGDAFLQRVWYGRSRLRWLLWPLSTVFAGIAAARRGFYRRALLSTGRVDAPVIIVGNITVGGTGKTPLVIWLATRLRERGWQPGVVLRGYRGQGTDWPRRVSATDDPRLAGDEAVLIARHAGALVVADPDRVRAARHAIELGADIVLSDDGLQHYRLARNCEIAVLDAERMLGNGLALPAGPLREPASRLATVDFVAFNQRAGLDAGAGVGLAAAVGRPREDVVLFSVRAGPVRSITTGEHRALFDFRDRPVHAVAGIGHPAAFFAALEAAGLTIHRHAPGDHAALTAADFEFGDDAPVLMTEKDAVKCSAFADRRFWAVTSELDVEAADAARLLAVIEARASEQGARIPVIGSDT
jgi:tetraacyldisaccharide 4'-kinase